MIFFEIICFEFPCVAGAQIPNPRTPSGKKSVRLRLLPFDAWFWNWCPQLLFLKNRLCLNLTLTFAYVFFWDDTDVIFAKFGFHIPVSRISSSIVFFWIFRSSFPKFWICFQFQFWNFVSGLMVFVFNKAFCEFVSKRPKFSLLWRCCFAEFFCWYELFMNLRADIQKWSLPKSEHKSFTTQSAPTYSSRNARWSHKHTGVKKIRQMKAGHIWKA